MINYIMKYSAIKRNEVLVNSTRMNLEIILLNKSSQAEIAIYDISPPFT